MRVNFQKNLFALQKFVNDFFKQIAYNYRHKCISVTSACGCLAYVTEKGRCFFYGRHIVTASQNTQFDSFSNSNNLNGGNSGIVGLEAISVASLALGKTHLVIVSKNGLLYTYGLNNLNQCGRDEVKKMF